MPKHLIMRKKFPAALDYRRASGRCGRLPIHSEFEHPPVWNLRQIGGDCLYKIARSRPAPSGCAAKCSALARLASFSRQPALVCSVLATTASWPASRSIDLHRRAVISPRRIPQSTARTIGMKFV